MCKINHPDMKIASVSEIKRELNIRSPEELREFCLRIAKFNFKDFIYIAS